MKLFEPWWCLAQVTHRCLLKTAPHITSYSNFFLQLLCLTLEPHTLSVFVDMCRQVATQQRC